MNIPSNSFKFRNTNREEIYKILINIDPNKAFSNCQQIFNLFVRFTFPLMCKTAKVKPLSKKVK